MMETFDQPEEAVGAFSRLARTKRRRGYGDAGVSGNG
jgi:predicted DNA-binding WGR domain protein